MPFIFFCQCVNVLLNVLNNERIMKMCARREHKISCCEVAEKNIPREWREGEVAFSLFAWQKWVACQSRYQLDSMTVHPVGSYLSWCHSTRAIIFIQRTHIQIKFCHTFFFIWICTPSKREIAPDLDPFFLSFYLFSFAIGHARARLLKHRTQYSYKRPFRLWTGLLLFCLKFSLMFFLLVEAPFLHIQGKIWFGFSYTRSIDFIFLCELWNHSDFLAIVSTSFVPLIKRSNWVMIKINNTLEHFIFRFQRPIFRRDVFCT